MAAVAALAVALVYVVLFWRLGVPTFWDPDEAHYAETSREMIASGDYLAPYYNDEPFFDKPALFHMLQASAMALLGTTELAARIVPALAALGLIAATGWVGSAVASRGVGLVAGLMLAATPGVFALARYAILDTRVRRIPVRRGVVRDGCGAQGSVTPAVARLCARRTGGPDQGSARAGVCAGSRS